MPKEHIEIFGAGKTAVINDFNNGNLYSNNKSKSLKSNGKGHQQEVHAFLTALNEGKDAPISFDSICLTTLTTFKIIDSLKTVVPHEMTINGESEFRIFCKITKYCNQESSKG